MKVWDSILKYYGAWKGENGAGYVHLKGGPVDPVKNVLYTLKGPTDYETVAASQSNHVLGNTGAVGDVISGVLIVPGTTGAGTVSLKDGSGTAFNIFVAGTLTDLKPIFIPFPDVRSVLGAWQLTTGANVTAVAFGIFTP